MASALLFVFEKMNRRNSLPVSQQLGMVRKVLFPIPATSSMKKKKNLTFVELKLSRANDRTMTCILPRRYYYAVTTEF